MLVKIHPRQAPGGRITDPEDLPAEKSAYAIRDLDHLRRLAAAEGKAIGAYTDALLDNPLPWTKMRQVYALLGLVKTLGRGAVEAACARALETEMVNVGLIGRMIERATEEAAEPAGRPTGRPPVSLVPGAAEHHQGPETPATEPSPTPSGPSTTGGRMSNSRPGGSKAVAA